MVPEEAGKPFFRQGQGGRRRKFGAKGRHTLGLARLVLFAAVFLPHHYGEEQAVFAPAVRLVQGKHNIVAYDGPVDCICGIVPGRRLLPVAFRGAGLPFIT